MSRHARPRDTLDSPFQIVVEHGLKFSYMGWRAVHNGVEYGRAVTTYNPGNLDQEAQRISRCLANYIAWRRKYDNPQGRHTAAHFAFEGHRDG